MTKKIKISSIEELMEISTVSGGAIEGAAHREKQTEALLRSYIRNKIATLYEQNQKKEQQLRTVIRRLIKEAKDVSNPHPNTGINKLRDAFRKAKPTIKSQFQQLTTSSDQRDSFIAHLLAAFVRLFQQLDALNATSDSTNAADATAKVVGGFDLEEPDQDAIDDIEKDLESLSDAWSFYS